MVSITIMYLVQLIGTTNLQLSCNLCQLSQLNLFTPPRPSEISMENWRAKVKPVLTPHL